MNDLYTMVGFDYQRFFFFSENFVYMVHLRFNFLNFLKNSFLVSGELIELSQNPKVSMAKLIFFKVCHIRSGSINLVAKLLGTCTNILI